MSSPTAQRFATHSPVFATAAMGCLLGVMTLGCADSDGDDYATFDEPTERTDLSRVVDPPIRVRRDSELDTSIDAILQSALGGETVVSSPSAGGCIVHHYEKDGAMVAVDERCAGSHRRLFIYGPTEDSRDWVSDDRVYGDYDDDGSVDAWYDPSDGVLAEDQNGDGATDRLTVDQLDVDAMELDSYNDDWVPPAYVASHILWDTDHDGFYDLETVMAGLDPEGNQTYWVER